MGEQYTLEHGRTAPWCAGTRPISAFYRERESEDGLGYKNAFTGRINVSVFAVPWQFQIGGRQASPRCNTRRSFDMAATR